MKRAVAVLAAMVWAIAASAQDLPALYDIYGVDHDDTLNIREEASASTPIIAELPFNARDVEVVRITEDGRWGLVNAMETSGWVAMRFMVPVPSDGWAHSGAKLSCGGTEPFWDITFNSVAPGQAAYRAMAEEGTKSYSIDWQSGQVARPDRVIGIGGSGPTGNFTAVLRQDACHDGMSDRNFGLVIDLFFHGNDEAYGLEGCCSVLP